MLLAIAVALIVLWAAGFLVFHVAGALIHLLIVLAIVLIVGNFLRGAGSRSAV